MRKTMLATALACLVALPVAAQFGGPGAGLQIDGSMLLGMKSVQDELKLTDKQLEAVKEATEARNKAFAKAVEDKDFQAMGPVMQDFGKALKKVAEKLDEKQSKRLMQIEYQASAKSNNPKIFANEVVQKELKFTDKQKDLVKETLEGIEKDGKKLFEDAQGDFGKMAEAFKKGMTLGKDGYEKITKSFDDDQKKSLETLGGEKFELNFRELMPGGFGKERPKKDDF
jgi:hypothetical protein